MKISNIANIIKGPWIKEKKPEGDETRRKPDYSLLLIILPLCVLGCAMVMISGSVESHYLQLDAFHFFKRHLLALFLGALAFFAGRYINFTKIDPFWLGVISFGGVVISIGLLALVLYMPADPSGLHRQMNIWKIAFQPSEVAKFCLIFYLAHFLAKRQGNLKFTDLIVPSIITGIIFLLIKKEPSLGTNVIIGAAFLFMVWMAGARRWMMASYMGIGTIFLFHEIKDEPYRLKRILDFLPESPLVNKIFGTLPDNTLAEAAYHTKQSLIAIGSGGLYGDSLGEGLQKYFVPEIHTDFIFSAIGNELGLMGTLLVLALFCGLIYIGFKIALKTRNNYLALMASGITFVIGFQAFYNIAMTLRCAPCTGMTLPLVSFGGTSLCMTLFALGILLNISTYDSRNKLNLQEKIKLEDYWRP